MSCVIRVDDTAVPAPIYSLLHPIMALLAQLQRHRTIISVLLTDSDTRVLE